MERIAHIGNSFQKAITSQSEYTGKLVKPTASVGIVLNMGMVLLGLSKADDFRRGKLVLPGGKIEAGENPYQACIREIKEEAGISVKCLPRDIIYNDKHPEICFILCKYMTGTIEAEYDEFEFLSWYPIMDLPRENMLNHNVEIIEKYIIGT